MTFDDIPEDREITYPCPKCRGVVAQNIISGAWECLDCDFNKEGKINMVNLTPEEEAILRPEYEKYLSGFLYIDYGEALPFSDWWRAKADYANED